MSYGEAQSSHNALGRARAPRVQRYARVLQQATRLLEHVRADMAANGLPYTAHIMEEALDAMQAAQEALAVSNGGQDTSAAPERLA